MPAARDLLNVGRTWYRMTRVVASRLPWRLAIFGVVALFATWQLLSTAPALNEFRDAHVLGHYETAARDLILRFHQAPLWDPYYCGGMYLLGTPQARFVSPTFLFTLLFGEPRGEALTAFTMIVVGLEGMFRYARSRGASAFGAFGAAPVFALSGIFAVAPALGWIGFFGFELMPWIALGIRRALRGELRGALVAAVAMAWCVGMGGTYAAPIAALWGAYEVAERLLRAVRKGRGRRGLAVGLGLALAAALLAGGLAAARLWPIADTLEAAPRIIGGTPSNTWPVLARMLLSSPAKDTDNGEFFIGLLALVAVATGFLARRGASLLGGSIAWGWLAAGYAVTPSLFALLRELPLYTTLRYPERFLLPLTLSLAALAALGVTQLEALVRSPKVRARPGRLRVFRALLTVSALGLLLDLAPLVHQHVLHADDRTLSPAPPPMDPSKPFHQARGNRWGLEYFEPLQRGSLSCWEAYPVPESPALRGDLDEEARVLEPGAGRVTTASWSPNAITLDVDLTRPATVTVNQNWHSGWRASTGQLQSSRGLLAVALPAGKQTVYLRFVPKSATGGAVTSLVALGTLIVLAWRAGRRRPLTRRDGLAIALGVLAPLVPVVAIARLAHEPESHEPLVAMDGRPVITDAPAPGLTRLDARFHGGVTLEAVRLSSARPGAGSDLVLEMDWRREAVIEKGLGIFMHVELPDGSGMNGDHVLLSSVLDLEEAPAGKTLRDVLPLWVPEDSGGKKYKVYVGLWRVRRGGDRLSIDDPGKAEVDKERVMVAAFDVQ